jgi:pyridoxal phosphate-dependent aminotransferase EpsN
METKNKRIYLSPPHMDGTELKYVQEAFNSNWITPLGPHVEHFENEMAKYVGAKGALALSSGTAAIHLALKLVGVSAGDIVFCSSLTFVASANPILYEVAIPIFIDSEPDSWNMSPAALRRAFIDAKKEGRLPKAVIVVNLYGQSADYDEILEICDSYGVPVIEDAAESLGATYKGKMSGTLGKFGIFSFNGNKIITTSGGGMLVSDDLDALEKARFWATQSREKALHYEHNEIGYNYRLSNICAAIGRGQLQVLEERIAARRRIFEYYRQFLSVIDGFKFLTEPSYGRSTHWLTTFTIDSSRTGYPVAKLLDLLRENQIEARQVWKPMHLQPIFKNCIYYSHDPGLSVSDLLFMQGICVPSGSNLTFEEQNQIIELIYQIKNSLTEVR